MLKVSRGYTLVELLIVIALLGSAIAFSLGSFSDAARYIGSVQELQEDEYNLRTAAFHLQQALSQDINEIAITPEGDIRVDYNDESICLFKIENGTFVRNVIHGAPASSFVEVSMSEVSYELVDNYLSVTFTTPSGHKLYTVFSVRKMPEVDTRGDIC